MLTKIVDILAFYGMLFLLTACSSQDLYKGFVSPPESSKPGVYWYWLNEHVSKEGITKDLQSLHDKGFGIVYIGNIFWGDKKGEVETLSDEWKECMQHAIREGSRIGINIGFFNCPGWSQAGGPWVKPEDAMRYLTYSEVEVQGPSLVRQFVAVPDTFFQDVSVIAYPIEVEDELQGKIIATPTAQNIDVLIDNKETDKICTFNNYEGEAVQIDIKYPQAVTKRGLQINPGDQAFQVYCDLFVKRDNKFVLVKSHYFDRIKREVRYGAIPSAPLALSFKDVSASEFRILLKGVPRNFQLRKLILSTRPILENYPEKWLTKIPSRATPDWFAHIWTNQEQISDVGIVSQEKVINISSCLKDDTLYWDVPKGKWKVLRIGMTTTNTTNQPAAPIARGLEIDKMNRRPIESHFNAYVDDITKGMSKEELKSLTHIIADSYETGPVNWTDGFDTVFVNKYGYDPIPWLPVLTGQIVNSADQSNRFLWDLRRLVAERVASEFVGGMNEACQKRGVTLWLENYGWDGFPSEFILYSKYSPTVGGEFWTNHGENIECRLASSAGHMLGKNIVSAESYTTNGNSYWYYPGNLKKYGDQSYAEGINHHILHLCIHQPYEKAPGVNSWFGIEYNRHNTWFEQSKSWIDYQRRCCYMLQQGKHHADVCYFISEESPRMSGWIDENLATGYDYDFVNSDVIENKFTVKNGKLTLPSGLEYSLLVLPPLNTMRPAVLQRIKELIEQGACVLGAPIERSPSLEDFPVCDERVQQLSNEIWGTVDYNTNQPIERSLGKGYIYCNMPINTVLRKNGVREAVCFDSELPLLWKQRKLDNGSIFFLSNQEDSVIHTDIMFNIEGYCPELWNPVDGTKCELPFIEENGRTIVPIELEEYESCFIVFTRKKDRLTVKYKDKVETNLLNMDDSWDITFFNKWTEEKIELEQHGLENWAESIDNRLKYFSGMIIYKNNFDLKELPDSKLIYLCFDNLYEVASVAINGVRLKQEIWCKPFRVNVASYLRRGINQIEVRVSNSWRNKIIEQNDKPLQNRELYYLDYIGNNIPSPSGIWGNVCLKELEYKKKM